MTDDYYDPEWVPSEAETFTEAAEQLERFDGDAKMEPRTAFLLARWFRSYAATITAEARKLRRTPPVDADALALAEHIMAPE